MTLQNAPPGLDYERDKKFSKVRYLNDFMLKITEFDFFICRLVNFIRYSIKCRRLRIAVVIFYLQHYFNTFFSSEQSFKQMIAMCLVKDPLKRPSAQKLLKHSFFKQARSNEYIARTILEGLPTLGDQIKELKASIVLYKKVT